MKSIGASFTLSLKIYPDPSPNCDRMHGHRSVSTRRHIYAAVALSVAEWSPKMRLRKSETMRGSPWRRGILGSHPRSSLAFVMSGFLLWGSSSVFFLNSIRALGSIVSCTTWASSSMVNSPGFPRLNGPTCSPSINLMRPSTCNI